MSVPILHGMYYARDKPLIRECSRTNSIQISFQFDSIRVAKDIIKLNEKRQSGYHDVLSDGIKDLKQQVGVLDLTEEEATILTEAAKVDGSIHKLKTMQTPQDAPARKQ
jgi:hypothetical protein